MSISVKEQLHGLVIRRLWIELSNQLPEAHFHLDTGNSQSSYTVNAIMPSILGRGKRLKAGLFIKHSTKRVTPWDFTFRQSDQDEIQSLRETCGEVFTIFVNGLDGVACLSYDQLKLVLDDNHKEQEWVTFTRKRNQSYRFKGNDGSEEHVLARNSFPQGVVDYLAEVVGEK